jgi:hypothetical protein
MYRGEAGRQRVEEELEKQKQRKAQRQAQQNQPFRVYVKPGTTKEVVVLDDAPDLYIYEHQLKDPQTGRWNIFTGCIQDTDNCPVCQVTGKEGYYALVLSVIDLEPYTTRDGKTIEWSRKLMVVKASQIKKFTRRFEKEGSLRGAVFELSRDGDKEPSIGSDIELIEFMEEGDLAQYKRSWKDREGKTHNEDCSVPYDYDQIFEEPTYESLAAKVGGAPAQPGSTREAEEELDKGSDDNDWDEEDEKEEKPARRTTRRSRRTRDDEVDTGEDDDPPFDADEDDEGEEEAPAPRRRAGRGEARKSARPARPGRTRRA